MLSKKVTSLGLLALVGGTMLSSSLTAFAAEGDKQSADTMVTYRNTKDIPDPDNPSDPDYVVSVPGNITFTDEHQQYDKDLHMYMPDGLKDYTGVKNADISVKSKNGFKLKNVKDEKDTVDYKMIKLGAKEGDKAVELKGTEDNALGKMNKTDLNMKLRYKLAGQAQSTSVYQDTVTYTVTSPAASK